MMDQTVNQVIYCNTNNPATIWISYHIVAGLFAVSLDIFIPWQIILKKFGLRFEGSVRKLLEQISQVFEYIQIICSGSLNDAVGNTA